MKLTRFRDIPLFTTFGSWQCHFGLDRVWPQINQFIVEGLDINPDFQRLHVWTEAQQIAYMEFVLRGGRTGRVIYLNHTHWSGQRDRQVPEWFVLVDGKQRLEAIRRFFADEIRVFGSLYSEYSDDPDMLRQGFEIHVNDLPTRADVLKWYIEMNEGGTPHTLEEIAKAKRLLDADVK